MKLPIDWFIGGLAAAVGLAWLLPAPGAHGGILHPEILNKAGVALIFFLSGVSLPFAALRNGMLHWRLHLVVQACTFLLFPLIGLLVYFGGSRWLGDDLRLGFFFLCALPSTVSSAVAMTATAKGNVPVAVLNASLSSVLGIFLTPLWLGLVLSAGGTSLNLGKVILDLCLWLLLPLALGQCCRPLFGAWAQRNKKRLNVVDRCTILMLVYTSFCDAVIGGVWTRNGLGTVALILVGAAALFYAALWATTSTSRSLGFVREDRIAAIFIGSTKSLASGVPMAKLIFVGNPAIGIILMPIMIYHPLQLVICGILSGRWAREPATATA